MGTQSDRNHVLGLFIQEQRFLPKTFAETVQNAANLEDLWILPFLKENVCLLDPCAGQNSSMAMSVQFNREVGWARKAMAIVPCTRQSPAPPTAVPQRGDRVLLFALFSVQLQQHEPGPL